MPETSANPILRYPLEVRLFLEAKMREPLSNKEIRILFEEKFPWLKGLTSHAVGTYRRKYVPEYKKILIAKYGKGREKLQEELEEDILETIKEDEEASEEFTKSEKQKMNQLKAHKTVLKELWNNYKEIKGSKAETPKARYLELMSRELERIGELEQSERSFLSAMDEIRRAELKETIEQKYDSFISWQLPRLVERCKDLDEARRYLWKLQLFINWYEYILLTTPSIEEANKKLLSQLYAVKKFKEGNE